MFRKIFCTLLICAAMFCQAGAVEASGITTYPALTSPEYWVKQDKDGDKLVLDAAGVENFNSRVRTVSRMVYDMANYPATASGDALKTRIMNYLVLEDDLYLHGKKVSDNYKNILRAQTNVKAIPATVNVRYAVTVRRSPVRNLPTGEGLFYYATDQEFDVLQETALDPGEAVAVLHQSANGYFYYVQSYNYSGWVSKFNLAFTDKDTWLQFAKPANFLVVTDAKYAVKAGREQLLYQQGARLPIVSEQPTYYVAEAPQRLENGNLQKTRLNIPKLSKAVRKGYLPYTANNILRSAFRFYGMPYGWGGLKDSVDCSALIMNAYRSVGIYLPRNADEQAVTAGTNNLLGNLDSAQKVAAIKDLAPGACLYMDGHAVMYIGLVNDTPYCLQALGSHFVNGERRREMQVVVSDLSLRRSSGNTFLEDLLTGVEFK